MNPMRPDRTSGSVSLASLERPLGRCLVWLLAALAPAAAGCGLAEGDAAAAAAASGSEDGATNEPEEDEAIPVSVGAVERGAMTSAYGTSATLRAEKRATVTARTQGVVRSLEVEEGDLVPIGQPLAVLEDDEFRIARDRAVATLETRQREYERATNLHEQGLLSDEEYDTKSRDFRDAKQAASLAELELSRTVVRAPFAGVIVRRHLDVGATVTNGTEVFDLADVEPLYADVNVPERHVVKLAPGQIVRLLADATRTAVQGRIERIAPAVDPATGTVKVTVTVDRESSLRPGAFVRVEVVTDVHEDATIVSRSALVAEGRNSFIYRLHEDGETVERLEVTIGFEEGDRVEILAVLGDARPLETRDRVVVSGASALSDGARVDVVPDETEDPADADAGDDETTRESDATDGDDASGSPTPRVAS